MSAYPGIPENLYLTGHKVMSITACGPDAARYFQQIFDFPDPVEQIEDPSDPNYTDTYYVVEVKDAVAAVEHFPTIEHLALKTITMFASAHGARADHRRLLGHYRIKGFAGVFDKNDPPLGNNDDASDGA